MMNVCLITSLKFVVMWQDPLKLLGTMFFSPQIVAFGFERHDGFLCQLI